MTVPTIDEIALEIIQATEKQVEFLRQLGYTGDTDELDIEQASNLIEKLKQRIEEAKQRILQNADVAELAGGHTELHRVTPGELAGACPKCGGNDRFHCTAEWFFCRQCHPKRGDAIGLIAWLNNISFVEAVLRLDGQPLPTPALKRQPEAKPQEVKPEEWRRKATALVDAAHRRLLDDDDKEAEAGRAYLENVRKLEPHTWVAFKLGYTSDAPLPGTWDDTNKRRIHPCQPAIVIPWYRSGKVVAIRYRFLQWHTYKDVDGKSREENKSSKFGSSFGGVLFGGQALDTGIAALSTLLICEGEINAKSIWQVSGDTHLDVLSLGSESATITPAMIEHAGKYATVLTWLDDEMYVKQVMNALPGAHGIKSPNGQDANDLLQAGALGGFLAMHRFQAARNSHEQERLLWDLCDAARGWYGVDSGTAEMIHHIAKTLDKPMQLVEVREGVYRLPAIVQPTQPIEPLPERPALPAELWLSGIKEYSEAWATWTELGEQYTVRMGQNEAGFYIKTR